MLSQISCVKDSLKRLQSRNVSTGTRKTNEKHDPPTWGREQFLAASSSGHAGARSAEANADSKLCSSGSQPGSQGLRALTLTLNSAPNPKAPHPSVWRVRGGNIIDSPWDFQVGARLFFLYITIIKNNHCCHWIFMLTTPGPDICIKISCRTLSEDFPAASSAKTREMSNSCCSPRKYYRNEDISNVREMANYAHQAALMKSSFFWLTLQKWGTSH